MWWLCCDTVTLVVIAIDDSVMMLLLCPCCCCYYCAWRGLLIYYLPWLVFTISPFNYFCLDLGVLPNHPLVCQLPSHHILLVLVVSLPITRQRKLFCSLVHCDILIHHSVGILSFYPSWHASSGSNSSFPLLGGMSSQQDISLKRIWVRTWK